jgi:hypothetical protein
LTSLIAGVRLSHWPHIFRRDGKPPAVGAAVDIVYLAAYIREDNLDMRIDTLKEVDAGLHVAAATVRDVQLPGAAGQRRSARLALAYPFAR